MAIYCSSPPPRASNVCQLCLCNHCLQKVVTALSLSLCSGEYGRYEFRLRGGARNKFRNEKITRSSFKALRNAKDKRGAARGIMQRRKKEKRREMNEDNVEAGKKEMTRRATEVRGEINRERGR